VSYPHMHALVALHGQLGRVAALTPLSVDGMDRRGVATPQLNLVRIFDAMPDP